MKMTERLEAEDPNFEILFDEEQIKERVCEIAEEISNDYEREPNTPLLLIGVLKGATPFIIDLSRNIKHPNLVMDYMGVSSYGSGEESSRKPEIRLKNVISAENKNVIIVEDIVDTGYSINTVLKYLLEQNPKSLKVCAFLSKPERREINVPIDYLGFTINDLWVQGYGLDTNERGRNWPYVAYKK